MANNRVFKGDTWTWTNNTGSDVASGQVVVIGQVLGVAQGKIAIGATGEVAVDEFVAECPKVSAAVIAQGETLTWDVSAAAFDDNAATPATGDVTKNVVAAAAAGNGETTVRVKFNCVAGIVT